jgi:hypothetical protein
MDHGVSSSENRHSSGRRRRHQGSEGSRVLGIRRKPRNQGAFGWFRKSMYNQKSPLIMLAILLAGVGVIAGLLTLLTSSRPNLPDGLMKAQVDKAR